MENEEVVDKKVVESTEAAVNPVYAGRTYEFKTELFKQRKQGKIDKKEFRQLYKKIKGNKIIISGIDKYKVGQLAGTIESKIQIKNKGTRRSVQSKGQGSP